jgi:hypothetical protein
MSERLIQIGSPAVARPPRSFDDAAAGRRRRPEWLRIRLATPARYHQVKGWSSG